MLLEPTIERGGETDPAIDHAQLFARGLEHVRELSRRLWTDHNTHDPGITILELLCYTLTDLSYRARFPIEDLLAKDTNDAANMAAQFFKPAQVLPNGPLTTADYRKLLIDLPRVKNAWISPAPVRCFADTVNRVLLVEDPGTPGIRPVDLRGLYRVRIEYTAEFNAAEQQQIDTEIMSRLMGHRNLCEDFFRAEKVTSQPYSLCVELDLNNDADPIEVAAQVRFQVANHLAPQVNRYSLAEMRKRRHPDGTPLALSDIFEGPTLNNGFIDDTELAESDLQTEVRLSDVISVIMDIKGVRAVRDITMSALALKLDLTLELPVRPLEAVNKWRLLVPEGRQPQLSAQHGRLVFYQRGMPVLAMQQRGDSTDDNLPGSLDAQVEARLATLVEEARLRWDAPSGVERDVPVPLGRYRDAAKYYSFQNHFPPVYGIAEFGLPTTADALRRVQALQLKGYLTLFDQIFANYLAQLANVRDLFSRDPDVSATYFAQPVETFLQWEKIYPSPIIDASSGNAAPPADYLMALRGLLPAESPPNEAERRGRFLNHLIARLGEDFHHYVNIVRPTFGERPEEVNALKCRFLGDYAEPSREDRAGSGGAGGERGLAYDYALTAPSALWNSNNVSGLERRLARLLGIADYSRRNLGTVSYDMYAEVDATPADEFRFRVKHPESGKILLSSSKHYEDKEAARAAMDRAIRLGQRPEAYAFKQTIDAKYYFNVVAESGEVVARRIEYFATSEAMHAEATALMEHLNTRYSGEGMYLIENILLRPDAGDPTFPICVDPDCVDCADDDPYSYRIHVVLPADVGRFQNSDFRRFVEETIRSEVPAHILPKICWINDADMAEFETAYRAWISLRAGVAEARRKEKLDAFVTVLFKVKNVYPRQRLHETPGDGQRLFILGRTALGSDE